MQYGGYAAAHETILTGLLRLRDSPVLYLTNNGNDGF